MLALACLTVINPSAPAAAAPFRDDPKFYPGLSEYQSMRAHDALRFYYNGNKPRAELILRDLGAHEEAANLPPLSRLLLTAMHGLTLHRDEAGTPQERIRVRAAFDSAAEDGLRRCAALPPLSTCGLIQGGIRGFRALLDLNTRGPTEVLAEGLEAVALLEEALEADSLLQDAHLGLGLFNVMAASNTPRVVRGMLRAAGRGVSREDGLAHLRRSGYEGQYTSVASQFFLIRFLSPFDDEPRREKSEIFRSLRRSFPLTPYVPFLQHHEALVFHPDSFFHPQTRAALARTIRSVEARDYAGRRSLQLLKHQYALLASAPEPRYRPDTAFDLGGYAFYPDFVEALRLRRAVREGGPPHPPGGNPPRAAPAGRIRPDEATGHPRDTPGDSASGRQQERDAAIRRIAMLRKDLLTRIRNTDKALLNPQTRGLLEWHVGHALRPTQFEPVKQEPVKRPDGGRSVSDSQGRRVSDAQGDGDAATTSKAAGKSRKPPER